MSISEEQKQTIIKKIKERSQINGRSPLTCSVCGKREFSLVGEGFANQPLQQNTSGGLVIGGPSLPSVVLICRNCGNTLYFNLGVLGELNGGK